MSGGEQPWPTARHATAGRASRRTRGLSLALGNARQTPEKPSVHRHPPKMTTPESGIAGTRKGASPSTGRRALLTANRVKSRSPCQGVRRTVILAALGNARNRGIAPTRDPQPPTQRLLDGCYRDGLDAVIRLAERRRRISSVFTVPVATQVLGLAWPGLGPNLMVLVTLTGTRLLLQRDPGQ